MESLMIESLNPKTGEVIGEVPVLDGEAVRAVVAKAREAAVSWAALSMDDRMAHLRSVRSSLVEHADHLVELCAAETGKPLADAYLEFNGACGLLTGAIRAAPKVLKNRKVSSWPAIGIKKAWVEYSPYGVIGEIAPWNVPIGVPGQILAVALAAGNVVVLKPSELTPLTGVALGEAINAAGRELVFVVTGYGATGEALVRSGVDKIAFTGSPNTGKRILAAAADSITPSVMELGGKDPMIIADDANPQHAAMAAVGGAFFNSGQACVASERVFVTSGIYDQFVSEAVKITSAILQSSGDDANIGSMTRGEQLPMIEQRLRDAEASGATILAGGRQRSGQGLYFEPTIITNVTPDMELMKEETFAPVLAIMRVNSVQQAVEIANDSEYALNASVFTKDSKVARRVASDLVAGAVNINDVLTNMAMSSAPFGGEKSSGFGRLSGREGLYEFSRTKTVTADRFPGKLPPMMGIMMTDKRPGVVQLRKLVAVLYGPRYRDRLRAALRPSQKKAA